MTEGIKEKIYFLQQIDDIDMLDIQIPLDVNNNIAMYYIM